MRKGDIVFAVNSVVQEPSVTSKLAHLFGISASRPNAIRVGIATGEGDEVCVATSQGFVRRQLLRGRYRLYSYRGPCYDEVRRLAVLLAQAHMLNWIDDDDFAEEGRRKAVLAVLRDAVFQSDAYEQLRPAEDGGAVLVKPVPRGRAVISAELVGRCFSAASEALDLLHPVLRRGAVAVTANDLEQKLLRDPRWHARNGGRAISVGLD